VATGDELVEPGQALRPGQIHDSNRIALAALAARAGAEIVMSRHVGDNPAATAAALDDALGGADVVVASGGVSVGAHDHVRPALDSLGVSEVFWGIALRPGKPTWFGTRGRVLFFGLPGNPVSALVTFLLLVRPALARLQGAWPLYRTVPARLGAPVPRRRARDEAVRVRLLQEDPGLRALPTGPQGSHILSSMLDADGLALIPAGEGELCAGERVTVELI
jgi:molybdopterin molybdotransferase